MSEIANLLAAGLVLSTEVKARSMKAGCSFQTTVHPPRNLPDAEAVPILRLAYDLLAEGMPEQPCPHPAGRGGWTAGLILTENPPRLTFGMTWIDHDAMLKALKAAHS